MEIFSKFDLNEDGKLTKSELDRRERIINIERRESRMASQKKMAWLSMATMTGFTIILFTPLVPVDRVLALSELLDLFYVGQASVVGAYMGFTAWQSDK
jgi:hypothetical protein